MFDRGFLYGDSVYEVTQTFEKRIFMLEEHLDRLFYSAMKMDMPMDYKREEITSHIKKVLERLNSESVYLRIVVTRGEGEIGLDPNLATKNNLIIIAQEKEPNPSWWYDKGVSVIIAHVLRNPKSSLDPNIKSGNYLNNVMAMSEAKKSGAFDAIMLNAHGQITEATTSNIWIVRNNVLITPPIKAGLLGGITRRSLIKIAKDNGISVSEENFSARELMDADECFLTSTTKLIVPITKVDKTSIANGEPGAMTKKLLKLYKDTNRI